MNTHPTRGLLLRLGRRSAGTTAVFSSHPLLRLALFVAASCRSRLASSEHVTLSTTVLHDGNAIGADLSEYGLELPGSLLEPKELAIQVHGYERWPLHLRWNLFKTRQWEPPANPNPKSEPAPRVTAEHIHLEDSCESRSPLHAPMGQHRSYRSP